MQLSLSRPFLARGAGELKMPLGQTWLRASELSVLGVVCGERQEGRRERERGRERETETERERESEREGSAVRPRCVSKRSKPL